MHSYTHQSSPFTVIDSSQPRLSCPHYNSRTIFIHASSFLDVYACVYISVWNVQCLYYFFFIFFIHFSVNQITKKYSLKWLKIQITFYTCPTNSLALLYQLYSKSKGIIWFRYSMQLFDKEKSSFDKMY